MDTIFKLKTPKGIILLKTAKSERSTVNIKISADLVQASKEMQQNLETKRMAYSLDSVVDYYTPSKRKPLALSELLNNQYHQQSKQTHAENYLKYVKCLTEEVILGLGQGPK